jgi:hypothetical protein
MERYRKRRDPGMIKGDGMSPDEEMQESQAHQEAVEDALLRADYVRRSSSFFAAATIALMISPLSS